MGLLEWLRYKLLASRGPEEAAYVEQAQKKAADTVRNMPVDTPKQRQARCKVFHDIMENEYDRWEQDH